MQKYKNLLLEVKKVFPESQFVKLIVRTSLQESISMEADIDKVMDALNKANGYFNEDIKGLNKCYKKPGESCELGFDGGIFVTNKKI